MRLPRTSLISDMYHPLVTTLPHLTDLELRLLVRKIEDTVEDREGIKSGLIGLIQAFMAGE